MKNELIVLGAIVLGTVLLAKRSVDTSGIGDSQLLGYTYQNGQWYMIIRHNGIASLIPCSQSVVPDYYIRLYGQPTQAQEGKSNLMNTIKREAVPNRFAELRYRK